MLRKRWGLPLTAMLAVSLFSSVVAAAEEDPDSCLSCVGRGKRIGLPFVRIAYLQIGMHVAATALWPQGYDPTRREANRHQFKKAWTEPPEFYFKDNIFESDNDWWSFNVFAHGFYGSEGYLAARGLGHGPVVSFGYAVFASFSWEYLVESFYKRPSAIDLFWTPAFGALLGELRFQLYRLVSKRVASRPARLTLQILIDPFGVLQRLMLGCRY